jgi:hypothetical protein
MLVIQTRVLSNMSRKLTRLLIGALLGLLGLGVVAFVAGALVGYLSAKGADIDTDRVVFGVVMGIAVLTMAGAMAMSVAWMRSIDEAAQEAHKSAWFWGGCAGLAVGGVLFIIASVPPAAAIQIPSWFPGRTDPVAYIATGAGALGLLMTAGYALAWAWWWWKRR